MDNPRASGSMGTVTDVVERLRAAGCVFAEEEAALLEAAGGGDLVARRVAGEPLEHVLGWVAFAGLRLAVGPGVFVPRVRTELMARVAVARRPEVLVELCCGIAPVAAAAEAALPGLTTWACDVDPAAVGYAARNLRGTARAGDLDASLPAALQGRVDVLACNAPYVPTGDLPLLPPEARDHEPRRALDGGADGLDVIGRVAQRAPLWLRPGGVLLVEVATRQLPAATALLARHGLVVEVTSDEGTHVVAGLSTDGIAAAPRPAGSS